MRTIILKCKNCKNIIGKFKIFDKIEYECKCKKCKHMNIGIIKEMRDKKCSK